MLIRNAMFRTLYKSSSEHEKKKKKTHYTWLFYLSNIYWVLTICSTLSQVQRCVGYVKINLIQGGQISRGISLCEQWNIIHYSKSPQRELYSKRSPGTSQEEVMFELLPESSYIMLLQYYQRPPITYSFSYIYPQKCLPKNTLRKTYRNFTYHFSMYGCSVAIWQQNVDLRFKQKMVLSLLMCFF